MCIDQRQHEALDVLHKKPEYGKAFRVFRRLHVLERTQFRETEWSILAIDDQLQFLPSYLVGLWPPSIVLVQYFAVRNDRLQFIQHYLVHVDYKLSLKI